MSGDSPRWLPPSAEEGARPERPAWEPPAGERPSSPWPGQPAGPGGAAGPAGPRAGVVAVGWMPRAGAALIDFVVRLAIVLATSLLAVLAAGGADEPNTAATLMNIAGFAVALAYAPVMIARTGGQTVGHRAVNTRIVRRDGSRLGGGAAAVREVLVKGLLFEGVAIVLLFVPTVVNYLWPLWDDDNETLHDKVCSTRVVEA